MSERILIIEDDTLLGETLSQTLEKNLYQVTWVKDRAQGLQNIIEIKPDLVLLHIGMPGGFEVLEAKAKNATVRAIPLIVISNSGDPAEISRVLTLGVKDYLVKAQVTPEEVLEKVRSLLIRTELDIPAPRALPSVLLKGKKILWVEDDVFLDDLIARRLAREECTLITCAKGKETFGIAEKEMPDIIMLDILMPDLDGMEILSHLKAHEKTKHIPVIMFSNLDDKAKIEKSRALGAVGFFLKSSVNLDEIVNEIKIALSRGG